MSKQQSTKAFVEGGNTLLDKIKQGIEQSHPDVRVDGSIESAFNEVRSVSGALAGGKAAGDIVGVDAHGGTDQYIKDKAGVALSKETTEAVAAKSFDNADIMKKKAQIILDAAGLFTTKDKEAKLQDMKDDGLVEQESTLDNIIPVTGAKARKAWAAAKAGAMESDERVMIGSDTLNISQNLKSGEGRADMIGGSTNRQGDKAELVRTDAPTNKQIEVAEGTGGDKDSVRTAMMTRDGVKDNLNPVNDVADAAGFLSQLTNLDPETAALVGSGIAAGGLGLTKYNMKTPGNIELKEEQLAKLDRIEEDGKLKGYADPKNGKMVANAQGLLLGKNGKPVERGAVVRAIRSGAGKVKSGAWNLRDKLEGFVTNSEKTSNGTDNDGPDHKDGEPKQHSTDKTDSKHSNPLNSDAQSITKNAENGKTPVESASNKVKGLDDAIEVAKSTKLQVVARN